MVILSSIFGFITAGIIFIFLGNGVALSLRGIITLIVSGFLSLSWIVLYLYALKDEDVSGVIPWFLTVPVFGYVLGYYVLGEALGPHQIIGGVIIILGGLILSIRKGTEHSGGYKVKWKPILYMTSASLLIALWGVLFKLVAKDAGFWISSFWEHIGLAVAGIIVLIFAKSYRQGFVVMAKTGGTRIILVNIFAEVLTIIGNLFTNYAILLVPVSLVYFIGVSQPIVVFILGGICTVLLPNIVKEDISKNNLLHKGISIAIMCTGGALLFI